MNRLIIVGNGFDLAHGMKTSFADFIKTYLCQALILTQNTQDYYEDKLIRINAKVHLKDEITNKTILKNIDYIRSNFNGVFTYKTRLFHALVDQVNTLSWVDIEIEFFSALLEIKRRNLNRKKPDQGYINDVNLLNDELDFIKEKLIEYLLKEEQRTEKFSLIEKIKGSFHEQFLSSNFHSKIDVNGKEPEFVQLLNFNYTNTLEKYLKINKIKDKNASVLDINYIHGNIDEKYGKPIFGFGDELNKDYLSFEDEKNNSLFKNMKSFGYVKNNNYFKLIEFLNNDDFQVYIMGHSCGVSDRVMLNEIFEHKNCKSIKVFYYQNTDNISDFEDKMYSIYMNFKDKGEFRKRVVPESLSSPLPQYNENKHLIG